MKKPTKIEVEIQQPIIKENGAVEVPSPYINFKNELPELNKDILGIVRRTIRNTESPTLLPDLSFFDGIGINGSKNEQIEHFRYAPSDIYDLCKREEYIEPRLSALNKIVADCRAEGIYDELSSFAGYEKWVAGIVYDDQANNRQKGCINYIFRNSDKKARYDPYRKLAQLGTTSVSFRYFAMWVKSIQDVLSIMNEDCRLIPFLANFDESILTCISRTMGYVVFNVKFIDYWIDWNKGRLLADQISQFFQNVACHELAHLYFPVHGMNHEKYMETLIKASIISKSFIPLKKIYTAKNLARVLQDLYPKTFICNKCREIIREEEIQQKVINGTADPSYVVCHKCVKVGRGLIIDMDVIR